MFHAQMVWKTRNAVRKPQQKTENNSLMKIKKILVE
jgi:hypothetical protein